MANKNPIKDFVSAVTDSEKLLLPLLKAFIRSEQEAIKSGKIRRKSPTIADAALSIAALEEKIREFNHGDEDFEDDDLYHPSAVGGCRRAAWFRDMKAPGELEAPSDMMRSYLTLEVGSYFHLVFQNLCQRAGVLKQREVAIIDRKNNIIGHADGIVTIEGKDYILELKTANGRNFILITNEPKHEHLLQIHAYMIGTGIKQAILIYYNKDTSATKEFLVKFDPVIEKKVRTIISEHFKNLLHTKVPPQDYHDFNRFPCSWCPYLKMCSDNSHLKAFLTTLKKKKIIRFKK